MFGITNAGLKRLRDAYPIHLASVRSRIPPGRTKVCRALWHTHLPREVPVLAKLAYACVLTRNLPGLAAFYGEVLQADPQWTGPYAEFPTGLGTFCLWSEDAYTEIAGSRAVPAQGTGRTMLEFEVDNVDAEFLRLQELSDFEMDFILPPTTMTWGNRSIYFRDPDGNLVNLFSHVGPTEHQDDGEHSHANR